MSKHTPGPWHYRVHGVHEGEYTIRCQTYGYAPLAIVRGDKRSTKAQAYENARLIAAAPDLLEALEGMLDNCYDTERDDATFKAVVFARAAIAKATGEQQ
jgi:hypothetical protein